MGGYELIHDTANSTVESPSLEHRDLCDEPDPCEGARSYHVTGTKHQLQKITDSPAKRGKSWHNINGHVQSDLISISDTARKVGAHGADVMDENSVHEVLGPSCPDAAYGGGGLNLEILDGFNPLQHEFNIDKPGVNDYFWDICTMDQQSSLPDFDQPNCVEMHNIHPADFLTLTTLDSKVCLSLSRVFANRSIRSSSSRNGSQRRCYSFYR
jgi:hypothetical protein